MQLAVTIRHVAGRAGVSVSSASRALSGHVDVSDDVRTRVLAAAEDLHYTVNLHARALKGIASKTLGVILYDADALTFNATMTRGIHTIATPKGYSLIVCNSRGDAEMELQAHQTLTENRVAGVLINSVLSGAAPLQRLAAQEIPFVLLNRRVNGLECDYVVVDNWRGSYLAACHLLELGHRHILCQFGSPQHPPTVERIAGYRQALQERGIPFDPKLTIYSENPLENHALILDSMRRLRPKPTAIMAHNDEAAISVFKALSDLSLRVPDDVSVIGHNDLSFAPYLIPPLTSVAQSIHEMGLRATEILLQKLAWPKKRSWIPQQVIFEPRFSIRLSCAPPRAAMSADELSLEGP